MSVWRDASICAGVVGPLANATVVAVAKCFLVPLSRFCARLTNAPWMTETLT